MPELSYADEMLRRHAGKCVNKDNELPKKKPRIGIYAGAFDPVHAGHVAFALQALQEARLDQVIFMPERRPRFKPGVEHYAHRIAMLKTALAPHPSLAVMEVVDRHFTVRRTLPLLHSVFPGTDLVMLMGSDTVTSLPAWPHAHRLLHASELVVGIRSAQQRAALQQSIMQWQAMPRDLFLIDSHAPHISSSHIREALRSDQYTEGLLSSVRRYAREQWLYVSPAYITV